MEGYIFPAAIMQTFVNGNCVYKQDNYGKHLFDESYKRTKTFF